MGSFELETATLGTEEGRAMFWFRNALDHRLWLDNRYDNGVLINDMPLLDVNEDNKDDWLLIHDIMHKAISQSLNLGITADLTVLDWDDEQAASQWVDSHSQLHIRVNQALGLL
jgi:hypothetical protein